MNTSMFFINGSVAGKVELKNLSDGTPVARFTVCVEVEEGRTENLPIAVWGELAEKAAYLLYDGAKASIMGSIIERDGKPVLAGRKIDFIDTDAAVKKEKKSKAEKPAQKPAKDKDDEDDGYDDEDDDSDDLDFFKKSEESEDESEDSEDDDSEGYDEYDDDDDDAFPF